MTTDFETEEKIWTLTAQDRCDSCNSQAYVHVKGISGELLFCGHHYNKANGEKLQAFAFEVIDERERLIENRLKSDD
jgi:hypothetical protein